MRYRQATTADSRLLAEMNGRLIRDSAHRNRMPPAELHARMQRWLAGEYRAVIFEDDAGPAGYALFRYEPDWVYLRQFFVEPARRRQGIGRAAIERLRDQFWQDSPRLRIDVLVGNAAGIAFWRSTGFVDYCITMERDR